MAEEPKLYNTVKWIEENKKDFNPPICNKMMHGKSQMKCFFVGGPNIRKDYHIEEGLEFFYMVSGDMCLKVMEQNKPRDVVIKQGEVFLLPARVPHSPQRMAGTVGLVIERERLPNETDGLRYFVEKDGKPTSEILYEAWFHCENLGPQLAAIVNAYFETEQCKTGVPVPGTILSYEEAPIKVDLETAVMSPFSLDQWLDDNRVKIDSGGSLDLFSGAPKGTHIKVYGQGETTMTVEKAEVYLWVLRGGCSVDAKERAYNLVDKDTLWLPVNTRFTLKVPEGSHIFMLYMEPV